MEGADGRRGLGGARKRGASGASTGSVLSAGSGHRPTRRPFPSGWTWIVMAASRRLAGLAWLGWAGRLGGQNPPAPSRGCSDPARNGAAEPRASPLYIGGGGGASPLMRAAALEAPPASSARARPLARAPGEAEGAGGGTPFRGSAADWLAGGMTSRAPFPRRRSSGRRVPRRSGGAAVRGAARPCRDSGAGCGEAGAAGGVRRRLPASWCNSLPSGAEPGRAGRAGRGEEA